MKEVLRTKPATVALGIGLALGLTACSNPFEQQADTNTIGDCPRGWYTENNSLSDLYFMEQSMANLEGGRAKLVATIKKEMGSTDDQFYKVDVPARYSAAASLLIGSLNESAYDSTRAAMSTPREEFCKDPLDGQLFQSPAYVRAAGALQASGIDINQLSSK